ncbi:MAG: DNA internalization-related competence protein ComEC/Rec2 [Deltaproteobacteria bacterium]|nr:DNA internalization-related competence protein ComEC/Rec2 [Deltaproteobacteria bacterium]
MQPLVPIFIAFTAGIIAAHYLNLPGWEWIVTPIFLLSLVVATVAVQRRWRYTTFLLPPVLLLGIIFLHTSHARQVSGNHIGRYLDSDHGPLGIGVEGSLYRSPERSRDRTRLFVEAERIFVKEGVIDVSGRVMVTVDSPDVTLSYGDTVRFLSRLKSPRNLGNPGEFDYAGYLAGRGIYVTGYVESERWVVKLSEGGWRFWRGVEQIRGEVRRFLDSERLHNGPLLKALLIGEKGEVGREVRETFVRTGTAHLLAISGLHIGIIATLVYLLAYRLLRLSERLMLATTIRKVALLLVIPPVIFYGLLAGFALPTQRAVIMIIAFAISFLIGRPRNIYNTMAMAALMILVLSPEALFSVSFQLSFAALFSIVYLTPRFQALLKGSDELPSLPEPETLVKRSGKKVLLLFLVSLSAGIGTAPVVAYHFHLVSTVGAVANIIMVPFVGFIVVPLGLLSLLFLPLWHGLASTLIHLADYCLVTAVWNVDIFSRIPFAAIWMGTISVVTMSLALLVILFSLSQKGRRHIRLCIPLVVLMLLLPSLWHYYSSNYQSNLKVTFLSVGQGDAAIVEYPFGKRMLIDGGGRYDPDFDAGRMTVAPFLRTRGIGRIDYVVLSHSQSDHAGGLNFIINNLAIGEFWWNGDRDLGTLGEALKSSTVPMVRKEIYSEPLEINGVKVEFLHPPGGERFDKNNGSLVLRLTYGEVSFIFPGDIEDAGERELLRRDVHLKGTILKVPHHGSRTSSSREFLNAVRPEIAVISVGYNNPFHFPHHDVVERYKTAGSTIYRTDRDGAVVVRTDGKRIDVERYRKPRKN